MNLGRVPETLHGKEELKGPLQEITGLQRKEDWPKKIGLREKDNH